MRIDKVHIEAFKNLIDFHIDLDQTKMHTVLLGENAAGKSNFLEALVIIFRDLDLNQSTPFQYQIDYQCKQNRLRVMGGPSVRGNFQMYDLDQIESETDSKKAKPISKTKIRNNKSDFFPQYVFSYYSGVSNRLLEHFDTHQRRFYKDLLDGVDAPHRPLFYARNIHSHFVLMAFYAFGLGGVDQFLEDYLGIVGLESVLFVLKKPLWAKSKTEALKFWEAKGVVREFLDDVWEASMAPITSENNIREDFRRSHTQEQLYLYISNQEKLQALASKYGNNTEFFKRLESTYISDLIQEVRVKVRKRNIDGDITFRELSEGEQQLLTVLGLLRFTKEKESLILLDEPDTHLNPLWKWQYMNLLEDVVQKDDSTQVIMTTHDPLVIGGLTREEIRVFYSEKEISQAGEERLRTQTAEPKFDPKGMGVAAILTGEFFHVPSPLDPDTQGELNEYRALEAKQRNKTKLSEKEKNKLEEHSKYFESLGMNKFTRDPLYNLFMQRISEHPKFLKVPTNKAEKQEQDNLALEILEDLLKEEES